MLVAVCSRPWDSGVDIVCPNPFAVRCLQIGIVETMLERNALRAVPVKEVRVPQWDIEFEAAKRIAEPEWRPEWSESARRALAMRFYEGVECGGLPERGAVQLICDFSAPAWTTAWEVIEEAALPPDRAYRNAWRRSPNGGPIYIDAQAARALRDTKRAA